MTSKGATGLGTVLTVVSLAAIAVFMFWLYRQSSALPETNAFDAGTEVEALTTADLLADPGGAVGRQVTIDSIAVAMGLGEAVFSLALDEATAYPVLLSPDMIQRFRMREMRVYGGDAVYVRGQVYTLTDSIRVEWVSQGALDRAMLVNLPRSPSFLLADSVDVF